MRRRSQRRWLSSKRRRNHGRPGALVPDGHHPAAGRFRKGHESLDVLPAGLDDERLILVEADGPGGSKIGESPRPTNHKHDQPKAPQGAAMVA
jgi:hypothetical protein